MIPTSAPVKSGFSTGTVEALKVFSTPEIPLKRGTALAHSSGDIFIIVALHYLRPTGITPNLHSVTLRRTRDEKQVERTVEAIRSEIEKSNLHFADHYNESCESPARLELSDTTLSLVTI